MVRTISDSEAMQVIPNALFTGLPRRKLFSWIATLGLVFLSSGCGIFVPNEIHYAWDTQASRPCVDCAPDRTGDEMVGLAFSGGGSRAAVFAAAAAEALNQKGILSDVTHLSSVSGGSFAAAYIGLRAPQDCQTPAAKSNSQCVDANFDAFHEAMRSNYFREMELNQVRSPWRITSPSYRVSSLAAALDDAFLEGSTFSDLNSRPMLFLNASDYDDGNRFLFSQQPFAVVPNGEPRYLPATLRANTFSQPGAVRATPGDFPVALAVATSAAFPGVLGPVTIQMPAMPGQEAPRCKMQRRSLPAACEYWHLGDGGILENTGVESLQEVILRRADSPAPLRRSLILSFDAGKTLDTAALRRDENPDFWTEEFARVVDIANVRAEAYRDVVWESIEQDLRIPYKLISFRLVDAELSGADWPASCTSEVRYSKDITEHLRKIPTDLQITTCDADITELAAHRLVEHKLTLDVVTELARQGFVDLPRTH